LILLGDQVAMLLSDEGHVDPALIRPRLGR